MYSMPAGDSTAGVDDVTRAGEKLVGARSTVSDDDRMLRNGGGGRPCLNRRVERRRAQMHGGAGVVADRDGPHAANVAAERGRRGGCTAVMRVLWHQWRADVRWVDFMVGGGWTLGAEKTGWTSKVVYVYGLYFTVGIKTRRHTWLLVRDDVDFVGVLQQIVCDMRACGHDFDVVCAREFAGGARQRRRQVATGERLGDIGLRKVVDIAVVLLLVP